MSEEDRLIANGRLVESYAKANSDLATLESEAKRTGRVVQVLANYLSSAGTSGTFSTGGDISDILSPKIIALVDDLTATRQHRDQLRKSLTNLGVD